MTKERLESLVAIADQIEDLEKDIENLNALYDRYEIIGRFHGESLSNADVLCQLDGDMLAIIIDYLTNKLNRLKDEFEEA
jgi:hypothetical protein